jgi:hypothetical protein
MNRFRTELSQDNSEKQEIHWAIVGLGQFPTVLGDLAQKNESELWEKSTWI